MKHICCASSVLWKLCHFHRQQDQRAGLKKVLHWVQSWAALKSQDLMSSCLLQLLECKFKYICTDYYVFYSTCFMMGPCTLTLLAGCHSLDTRGMPRSARSSIAVAARTPFVPFSLYTLPRLYPSCILLYTLPLLPEECTCILWVQHWRLPCPRLNTCLNESTLTTSLSCAVCITLSRYKLKSTPL